MRQCTGRSAVALINKVANSHKLTAKTKETSEVELAIISDKTVRKISLPILDRRAFIFLHYQQYCYALLLFIAAYILLGCREPRIPPSGSEPITVDLEILSSRQPAPAIIVFVHGILGDAITTFSANAQTNWPLLLSTDPSLGQVPDIISVGYVSTPIGSASNINEISTRLLTRLRDKKIFSNHQHVIFVVHSMGGLVTKRMLMQLKTDSPQEYKKVAGVFFLATPSGGSDLAKTAAWMSLNPQFKDMAPLDINTLLQQYEDDWGVLLQARTLNSPYPKIFCVYETQPMGPVKIVPRSHAQGGCDERPIAFDRNHSNLVKPASRSDEVYQYVIARIQRIFNGEYLPLTLSADLLTGNDLLLPKDSVMKSGDQFSIRITASKAAWFYVVLQDSNGKISRLFPSKPYGAQDTPTQSVRLPQESSLMLQLDREKGVERFYFFATNKRSDELEHMQASIATKPIKEAQATLDTLISKRGVVPAKKHPIQKWSAAPPHFNAATIGAEAVATISIAHL